MSKRLKMLPMSFGLFQWAVFLVGAVFLLVTLKYIAVAALVLVFTALGVKYWNVVKRSVEFVFNLNEKEEKK